MKKTRGDDAWGHQPEGGREGKERIRRGEEEGICCIYTSKDSIMKPSTV
jgi:hypothetical protein